MREIKKILRALESFNNSSSKTIQLKNEKFICSGMNSPYISHQKVAVDQGHGKSGVIILNEDMIIYKVGYEEDVEGKEIPSIWIKKALEVTGLFPIGLPKWLNFDFVRVQMPDRFRGYDEQGCPIWDNRRVIINEYDLEFVFQGSLQEEEEPEEEEKDKKEMNIEAIEELEEKPIPPKSNT